jgi:hypothetical protein
VSISSPPAEREPARAPSGHGRLPVARVAGLLLAAALMGLLAGGTFGGGADRAERPAPEPEHLRRQPQPSVAFWERLPGAVGDLDAARAAGRRGFAVALHSGAQVRTAHRLAHAHEVAGARLAPLAEAGDGLPTATVDALRGTAAAYARLASAARARDASAYGRARRGVTAAESRLRLVMTRLGAETKRARAPSVATAKPARIRREPVAGSM